MEVWAWILLVAIIILIIALIINIVYRYQTTPSTTLYYSALAMAVLGLFLLIISLGAGIWKYEQDKQDREIRELAREKQERESITYRQPSGKPTDISSMGGTQVTRRTTTTTTAPAKLGGGLQPPPSGLQSALASTPMQPRRSLPMPIPNPGRVSMSM